MRIEIIIHLVRVHVHSTQTTHTYSVVIFAQSKLRRKKNYGQRMSCGMFNETLHERWGTLCVWNNMAEVDCPLTLMMLIWYIWCPAATGQQRSSSVYHIYVSCMCASGTLSYSMRVCEQRIFIAVREVNEQQQQMNKKKKYSKTADTNDWTVARFFFYLFPRLFGAIIVIGKHTYRGNHIITAISANEPLRSSQFILLKNCTPFLYQQAFCCFYFVWMNVCLFCVIQNEQSY